MRTPDRYIEMVRRGEAPLGGEAVSYTHLDVYKRQAQLTAKNKKFTLNIAFNYGGRAEIVDAVARLVADKVPAGKVDEKAIRSRLYHPEIPDPDLVVRTSGEYRISNFLLWELAYSELVFSDVLWPDFRREDLYRAIEEYQRRVRRFGGVEQ